MSSRDEAAARRLFRQFREAEPGRARRFPGRIPKALAVMGLCEFVGYLTTHKGEPALYIHEFAPGSRPLLAAAPRRGQLYLVGGRFTVTARGIVDTDAQGRAVHARRRYEVKVKRPRRR